MIELYFNDANLLPENREEEQYAEVTLKVNFKEKEL